MAVSEFVSDSVAVTVNAAKKQARYFLLMSNSQVFFSNSYNPKPFFIDMKRMQANF